MDESAKISAGPLKRGTIRTVNDIVEEIFTVFENVHSLLVNWNSRYHITFIREVMKLKRLEDELNSSGYDNDFADLILKHIYDTVFKYDTY